MVRECLQNFGLSYNKSQQDFLTEGDSVSSLFCILKKEMERRDIKGFKIHRELRPYTEERDTKYVIKVEDKEAKWGKQETRNSGAVVDIVIVDDDMEYFEAARDYSPRKYWRILSYPLEAFVACIEVKIKVFGNNRRITKDIDKLCLIRETVAEKFNRKCLVYMCVMDRRASSKSIRTVEDKCCQRGLSSHRSWLQFEAGS